MAVTTFLTGAGGFVGPYVARVLMCTPLPPGVDLRDRNVLSEAVAEVRPDSVIHLVGQSFVGESFKNPRDTFDINFYGTLNLLEALRDSGFRGRMLFVGSGDAYGLVPQDSLPVNENCPLRPRNPYAVSKVAAEALCYQWSQTSQFEIVLARSFNHIGPGQSPQFAIADFERQIREIRLGQRDPELFVGDIDVTRDFTDVRDVAQAYACLLESGRNGEVYNVCSGVERSVRSLIERMVELTGLKIAVRQDPSRMRPAEQRRMVGNRMKIQKETGWVPTISIENSLNDLIED